MILFSRGNIHSNDLIDLIDFRKNRLDFRKIEFYAKV